MAISSILEALGKDQRVRLTELGKIKIGGLGETRKKTTGTGTYRLPQKHDYFTVTTLNRSPAGDFLRDEDLMNELISDYGDDDGKLRQIPIRVLSDDIDDIVQSRFCWYGGKVCGASSDGKTTTWFVDPQTLKRYPEPIVEDYRKEILDFRDGRGNKLFKLHSVLNCVIASKEARFGGVYKFRTTSQISFNQLISSLTHTHQLTGGVLIGMPLMMVIRPVQVSPEGQATTVYVVHIELRGVGLVELQQQAVQQMQFRLENRQRVLTAQNQYRKLLMAPGEESNGEAADIASEFHPEMSAPEPAPEHYSILDDEPTRPANPGGAVSEPISLPSQPAPSSPAAQAPAKTNGKPKKPEPQKIDDDPRSPKQAAEEYSQNVPVKELIDWLIALPAKDKETAMTVAQVRNLMGASDDDVRNVAFNARLVLETRKREGK